jgi:hypothetical protein
MKSFSLTKEEVEMILDNATDNGRRELIAYTIEWTRRDEFNLKAIVRYNYEYSKTGKAVMTCEYGYTVYEDVSYSEYLGRRTRLKFIASISSPMFLDVDEYFEQQDIE